MEDVIVRHADTIEGPAVAADPFELLDRIFDSVQFHIHHPGVHEDHAVRVAMVGGRLLVVKSYTQNHVREILEDTEGRNILSLVVEVNGVLKRVVVARLS